MSIPLSIRRAVKALSYRIAPRSFARVRLRAIRRKYPEPELRLLPALITEHSHFVDIGANAGVYTLHALRYAASASAFEPLFTSDSELSTLIRVLRLPVTVHAVALSDEAGLAEMRIVEEAAGLSTIEPSNPLTYSTGHNVVVRKVERHTLDSYDLENISLIKVDVEGHELSVLEGATTTLNRTRPAVIVEAEDRHAAGIMDKLIQFFSIRNYRGLFLQDGVLHGIDEFRTDIHQNPEHLTTWDGNWERLGLYINNFTFIPGERSQEIMARLAKIYCLDESLKV